MRVLVLFALVSSLAGCAHVREARALQPNPLLAQSPDVLPISARLFIYQRDVHLPHEYALRSSAQFAVVSRDRLVFHVTVVRYDEDEADIAGWTAYLEDETGQRYPLGSREGPRRNRLSITWRLDPRYTYASSCVNPPCLTKIIPGYDVYQGVADLVFYAPRIMDPTRKALSLVLRRGDLEYRYAWRFGSGVHIEHYGRTRADEQMGFLPVPGPGSQVAGIEDEVDWNAASSSR